MEKPWLGLVALRPRDTVDIPQSRSAGTTILKHATSSAGWHGQSFPIERLAWPRRWRNGTTRDCALATPTRGPKTGRDMSGDI